MATELHLTRRSGAAMPPLPFPQKGTATMPNFIVHRLPVLAVRCPSCGAAVGNWCRRPSGHRASDLHADRGAAADRAFIEQHGEFASIERTADGWQIDPRGRARD